MKPHFHFVTLFPDTIRVWLETSIIGRAHKNALFDYTLYQLRDYSEDKHRSVDDTAFGGGGGMILRIEPLVKVTEELFALYGKTNCRVIYFSPAGKPLHFSLIDSYHSQPYQHYILICGHYEGIDQRYVDHWVDEEITLGDFVLSGGEIPALAFTDAFIRQLEGTIAHDPKARNESFHLRESSQPLLEYPHYTRPSEFRGHKVPEVLLSGDHRKIEEWRMKQSRERTQIKRPDLHGYET